MLVKQSSISIDVSESGSIHILASIKKGWGGIRNVNTNSCKIAKARSPYWFCSVEEGCVSPWVGSCASVVVAPCPAEHRLQPDASQKAAGTPRRAVMEDPSSQEILLLLKVSR